MKRPVHPRPALVGRSAPGGRHAQVEGSLSGAALGATLRGEAVRRPDPGVTCAGMPRRPWPVLGVALLGLLLIGCSTRSKKLTDGDVPDRLMYDVFGQKRSAAYYYRLVRDSMDESTGCYRCTEDPFIVDKSVNAVLQLGEADFDRLEGQAQTVDLLAEVLLEAPSPLAQSHAANSLAKIGLRMPPYAPGSVPDGGSRTEAAFRELDTMFDRYGRRIDARSIPRQIQVLDTLGEYRLGHLSASRSALQPFFGRSYLIDEADPRVRRAIDTAMTRRMHQVISLALASGVQARTNYVREESVRGLKTLRDVTVIDPVLTQWEVEQDARVRGEMVEYFGRVATSRSVAALLPVIDDADSTIRYKARLALTRAAGRDLGRRRGTWERWAQQRYPGIALEAPIQSLPANADSSGLATR